ncbi:MAG: DUF4336 domain-containing protein [Pseudomonadota bacterium]
MLKNLGQDIWIYDGPKINFAGADMHTRMTVVRLTNGRLWVHSPTRLDADSRAAIETLGGEVAALVAPNKYHHLYIEAWIDAFPHAHVYAEPHVQAKVASLSDADILTDSAPPTYAADLEQVIFTGNRLFQEAVFFHKHSKTVIFTDLFINQPLDDVSGLPRLFLQFEGVAYPSGGIPRLYRWFSWGRSAQRRAAARVRQWQPERLTFAHGPGLDGSVREILDQQFAWLD